MTVNFKPLAKPTRIPNPAAIWDWLQRVYDALSLAQAGKLNCVATVTLTASSTTTDFNHELIGTTSAIILVPRSANAAAAMNKVWVSAKSKGSATLTHDSTADTDRDFDVVILG